VSELPLLRSVPAESVDAVIDLVRRAVLAGASDVHFLPQDDGMLIRLRVDGVLHDLETIPLRAAATTTSRVKVLAELDVADHQKAQDGRFAVDDVDIRVAVLPTVVGEGLILRLLRTEERPPSLTELGLGFDMQMELERVLSRPNGLLLVAGPTGAGKSTTLYACLADVNRPEVSTVTIEDPVEYRVPRAYQIQVNEKRGLTFPTALRSILRSDPDIIMVGEIRDSVTAQLVIEASLSGHFVLSTLHSDDAPRTLTRLSEMGVPPYLISTAVSAVLAQRLARKLCEHCREPFAPPRSELEQLGHDPSAGPGEVTLYRARGCDHCTRGYKGRIGIFQLLTMSEAVAFATTHEGSYGGAGPAAAEGGMKTLWADGLHKAEAGLTTIEELRRVVT
jgi:type II secretory ATPase GspE/PulE/Tfp pilus assembly ATPase PilB-like protein